VRREAPTRVRPAANGGLRILVVLLVVLNLTGLVMVLSASSIVSIQQFGTPWYFFERQCIWLAFGVIAFLVAVRGDYRKWRRLSRVSMVVTVLMLVAVLVPGIGVSASGASRWLGNSTLEIQPSELAKLSLILFAADVLDRREGARDWKYQMLPVMLVFGLLAALVMKQPDMGTTMVLASITVAMLLTAGLPARPLAGLIVSGAVAASLLAVAAPYRLRRLLSFRHPFSDASDSGWQLAQALLSMGNGGVTGNGIGSSIASYGFLPNAQTDFIFAVIGEETGLAGSLLLASLFACLAVVGVRIACRAKDGFGAYLAAGIVAWLVGQAVIGLLPVTGVPLPFVSFGGSSLVIALFGVGLLANIARRS
jgi:cell division protein FtsW